MKMFESIRKFFREVGEGIIAFLAIVFILILGTLGLLALFVFALPALVVMLVVVLILIVFNKDKINIIVKEEKDESPHRRR